MADLAGDAVVVTGLGAAWAVGDSVHGVAALRAGLARPSPSELVVARPDDELPMPIRVHACRGLDGYQGLGRLLALLRVVVADLRRQGAVPPEPAATFVLLPDFTARPRVSDTDERDLAGGAVRAELERRLGPVRGDGSLDVRHGGRCGAFVDLAAACERLRTNGAARCLLVGVDSQVELATLEELYGADLLQTPADQDGYFAGEGAALVQVERADAARRHGRRALAVLGAPVVVTGEGQPVGAALARAVQDAGPVSDVWTDLDGESWRANDWGNALQRLAGRRWPGSAARMHQPVEGTGELGAATAASLLVLAVRAAARPGAGAQLVVVADANGDRAALTVLPPPAG